MKKTVLVLFALLTMACAKSTSAPTALCNDKTLLPNLFGSSSPYSLGDTQKDSQRIKSFPITIYVNNAAALPRSYIDNMLRGVRSWSIATQNRVGTFSEVQSDSPEATLRINLVVTRSDANVLGEVFHDGNVGGYATRLRLEMNIGTLMLSGGYDLSGTLEYLAPHEFGHAMGLFGHANPGVNSVMVSGDGPLTPTTLDVNTILTKYGCPS